MAKLIALVGLPRSGTTPVASLLAHYYKFTEGREYLGEYFFQSSAPQRMNDASVRRALQKKCKSLSIKPGLFFFKEVLFPTPSNVWYEDWLLKNCEIIFLVRKNQLRNFLSYGISMELLQWYPKGGIKLKRPLEIGFRNFVGFVLIQRRLLALMRRAPRARVLFYEDFVKLSPKAFLRKAGCVEKINLKGLKQTERVNSPSNFKQIQNLDEIKTWFKTAGLGSVGSKGCAARPKSASPNGRNRSREALRR